jgi:short-chain fatty acids transporter
MDDSQRQPLRERLISRLVTLLERYLPDAFLFALLASVIVLVAGYFSLRATAPGSTTPTALAALRALLDAWGKGFFSLLPFTLQMALVIISGHIVASARPMARLLDALSAVPRSARFAPAWVTLFALISSWLNWGFSLIFSALLARAVARRFAARGVPVDYRALAAASFLGLGSIWAQGLSGSAALQMATPGLVPADWNTGVIALTHTIFLWQSLLSVAIEIVVVTLLMWWASPTEYSAVSAAELGVSIDDALREDRSAAAPESSTPGQFLEHRSWLNMLFCIIGGGHLVSYFAQAPAGRALSAVNLNVVILVLLVVGAALHKTPARLQRAFAAATPAVWGVLLQFPFYGAIAGVLSHSALNERIAGLFVGVASRATLPPLIALYSAVLGIFVPSGGSKWVIEAPYVLAAAHHLKVHLGWMVAVYDLGEALANLVQPFWMLPVLGLLGLKARQVMGYTFLVFVVLLPLVLLLTFALGLSLSYPL